MNKKHEHPLSKNHKPVKHKIDSTQKSSLHTKKKSTKKKISSKNLLKTILERPSKLTVGWQEWCTFPKLHLPAIKAKIDTGAKTSALHAWEVNPFHRHGVLYVHFIVHPLQRNNDATVHCTAEVIDQRTVMSSGGHKQHRYVIHTPIIVGDHAWEIEVTLTNRDAMSFRMLLGRDALKGQAIVDPQRSLCQGKYSKSEITRLYL